MFEFLFKYPLTQYQQAEWFFASGWSLYLLIALITIGSLGLIISVALRKLSLGRKLIVAFLQIVSCVTLLTLLWQPSLRSSVIEPGDNSVVVLLDTSRSMHYPSPADSRLKSATEALKSSAVLNQLASDFQVDLQSIADSPHSLDLQNLPPPGDNSRLKTALTDILDRGSKSVLSGVVMLSDGADTSKSDAAWWQRVVGYGVPVYTVGVGRENLTEDLSLESVSLRDSVTPDTRVNARIAVQHGRGGQARLRVTDGKALVYSANLVLPETVSQSSHAIVFNSGSTGIRDLLFELEPRHDEINTANNSQRRILAVKDEKKRILYIEGEPRWEFKFIRRAVSESAEIEIVSLLQTSPNKFYRQGVTGSSELKDGFPLEEKSLFGYDAIIIGSIEAAKLNVEQQKNLRDFVRVRGGALLMLAGPRGLSQGGWARTALAQALPVLLEEGGQTYSRRRVRASVTELGLETDWLRFAVDDGDNRLLWDQLPDLADVQNAGTLKAGAAALLEATVNDVRLPLLVRQRYGRGKSFVLATSGTWRWQMGLPATDQRHEQFWQGLLGELVAGSLSQLTVATDRAVYYDEERVTVTVDARDEQYQPDLSARLSVSLTSATQTQPSTNSSDVKPVLLSATDTPGRYQAQVAVPAEGEYAIRVSPQGKQSKSQLKKWFLREDNRIEDFALAQDKTFLSRLASATGGRYLNLTQLEQLPQLMRQSQALLVKNEVLPLWSVPAAFLLLLLCKLVEWLLRLRWNRI